jgi:hypothetical protein
VTKSLEREQKYKRYREFEITKIINRKGRKSPLPPKGGFIQCHSVELHFNVEFKPPFKGVGGQIIL